MRRSAAQSRSIRRSGSIAAYGRGENQGDVWGALRSQRSDPAAAHAIYHDDAVLEFPQSGERFEGVENFRGWRSNYPVSTSFELGAVSYTHLRAHETKANLVCRL